MSLLIAAEGGGIRNLRRQVRFPLQTRRPDGLLETVCTYVADFVYDEPVPVDAPGAGGFCLGDTHKWVEVVEDTKPGGFKMKAGKRVPFREEVYELKRKWFQAQYGKAIRET